jgi:hypothetical protein
MSITSRILPPLTENTSRRRTYDPNRFIPTLKRQNASLGAAFRDKEQRHSLGKGCCPSLPKRGDWDAQK